MKQLIKVFNDAQRIKKRKELLQNVVLTPELELVLADSGLADLLK